MGGHGRGSGTSRIGAYVCRGQGVASAGAMADGVGGRGARVRGGGVIGFQGDSVSGAGRTERGLWAGSTCRALGARCSRRSGGAVCAGRALGPSRSGCTSGSGWPSGSVRTGRASDGNVLGALRVDLLNLGEVHCGLVHGQLDVVRPDRCPGDSFGDEPRGCLRVRSRHVVGEEPHVGVAVRQVALVVERVRAAAGEDDAIVGKGNRVHAQGKLHRSLGGPAACRVGCRVVDQRRRDAIGERHQSLL